MTATITPPRAAQPPVPQGKPRKTYQPVKTPSVLQMEAVECGAASLSMVLAHFKRYVPLEELRVVCGVSRDGSKASNLLKAARSYGLVAKGLQTDPDALAGIKPPAVVFWEFNHFLVLEGVGKRWGKPVVFLNDPAQGRRTVTAAEFDESFTGIVLGMEPGPDFRPGGKPPGLLAGLPARMRGTSGLLALSVLASLLLVVVSIATPAFTRAYVDSVLLGGDTSILLPFFSLMAATIGITLVATALRQSFQLRARTISATLSSARFFRHLLRLPVGFFTQRSPADVTNRMRSNDDVAEILARDLSTVVIDALVVMVYAGLLWSYNPQLTVLGVAIALLNIVALRLVVRIRANGVNKLAADEAHLLSVSYNGLELIETLKATGGENEYFRKWAGAQAKVLSGQQKLGTPSAMLSVVAPALAALNSAMILLIGGLQAVGGHISIGVLVAFQTLVTSFSAPIARLTSVAGRIQDFGVDVARLRDVENFPPDELDAVPEPEDVKRLNGHVRFERITFGYNPLGKPLLEDFSFAVGPGEQVALVGGSGSGKSTATRLISGLYRPWGGQVQIDGVPRADVPRSVLAASVTFVDQDICLFEGTVRDNVTLWDQSIPDEDVITALKDAAIYDVISGRRGGIHSRVEQDGRNFSGGQRQRMEIARALVRNPSVLVLDEATSALDSETELRITDNVRRRGCACIVIAHRLSTIRDSDEILVLDKGVVVERGRHPDLVAAGGRYAALIKEH
ncbi:NHLP family bacteriocin export ABC transporter peptidase/permease/ATPase subunit [Lentzea tibetensis]|uniref:NHLP family bacteriocin export ABC transporter peptidase/permease/ATPase subunit n=1 Tax=Lentzea tibetensis TaxID=2591470 RepID=A0A563ESI6_9PSEU|nr:NHLP family bacteriocin export ABC transporter peptidase/permease/ATPase subunit [Lentzea tibetensis]TWP50481.1 NHLP family bacteriocin export ABC transporter peptidase/permease/ATPase subunit [Lentzea tibetensis]